MPVLPAAQGGVLLACCIQAARVRPTWYFSSSFTKASNNFRQIAASSPPRAWRLQFGSKTKVAVHVKKARSSTPHTRCKACAEVGLGSRQLESSRHAEPKRPQSSSEPADESAEKNPSLNGPRIERVLANLHSIHSKSWPNLVCDCS